MEDYLYKYYSFDEKKYSITNLENGIICFNNLNNFNDPFEGIGAYDFIETEEEKEYWKSIGVDMSKNLSKRFSDDDKEAMTFYHRVTCFTDTYTNPLMWAHYASSHTGFCVGYSKDEIENACDKLDKIKYCTEMPTTIVAGETYNIHDRFNKIIYSKSMDWSYENEWRAVYNIKKDDVLIIGIEEYFNSVDKEKNIYYCIGMPGKHNYVKSPSIIMKKCKPKVIYIGLKTKQENRESLIKISREQKIKCEYMNMVYGKYEFSNK